MLCLSPLRSVRHPSAAMGTHYCSCRLGSLLAWAHCGLCTLSVVPSVVPECLNDDPYQGKQVEHGRPGHQWLGQWCNAPLRPAAWRLARMSPLGMQRCHKGPWPQDQARPPILLLHTRSSQ